MFQYCDETSLTIGGGSGNSSTGGRGIGSAIYLSDYFKKGTCHANCQTFEKHEQLSGN